MTKAELIDIVFSANEGITKKASAQIVDHIFDSIQKSIKEENKFTYPGFGTFEIRHRKARTGRDPRTGEPMPIGATKTVGFRPAKAFKQSL
jgi:DNA-binding protein HU-beta